MTTSMNDAPRKFYVATAGYPWPQGKQIKYHVGAALLTFNSGMVEEHVAKIWSCPTASHWMG